jgi:Na+/proline symporter
VNDERALAGKEFRLDFAVAQPAAPFRVAIGGIVLDLLIVAAFVAYAVTSGLRARRRASTGLEEYFLAGRSLPGWRSGLSMAATQFAADTPLLATGLVATAGIFALWRLWIYALAFLLLAFVFAAVWRRSGVLTDAELTELRYSGQGALALRVLKAIYYSTIINCVVLGMVLFAAVKISAVFLPWHLWLPDTIYAPVLELTRASGVGFGAPPAGLDPVVAAANGFLSILLMVGFTAAYSTTGGLRSVVNTDTVQLAIALAGTAVYAWFVLEAAGGLGGMTDRVVAIYGPDRAAGMLGWLPRHAGEAAMPFLMILSLQWLFQMNSDGTGYLAQRSIACRSDRDARIAGVLFTWVQILLRSLLWLAIAIGLLILFPFVPEDAAAPGFAAAREATFVTGIDELLPAGARGLMLTGLLAALTSTVDTHLNWGASYWSNDIYDRLICRHWLDRAPRPWELVLVARVSGLVIVLLALVVMLNVSSIQAAWSLSLLFGAGMGSVLVLRWLWERINLYSEIAAMAVSILLAPLLLARFGTAPETEWLRLLIMAGATTAAAIAVTFVTPPTDDRALLAFFRRVSPVGFWGRTARLAGSRGDRPRAELGRGLVSVLLTVLSLFLVLVGLGQLLFPPIGIPGLLSWVMLAAGIGLVPLWWRRMMEPDGAGDAADAGSSSRQARRAMTE